MSWRLLMFSTLGLALCFEATAQTGGAGLQDLCVQLSKPGALAPGVNLTCGAGTGSGGASSPNLLLASKDCDFLFSCDYYQKCIGKLVDCAPPRTPNYFKDYGGKYCAKFKDSHDHPDVSGYSESTKLWTRCTMICLQRSLDKEYHCSDFIGHPPAPESANDKCLRYYNKAFNGHPSCYTDSGLCLLAPPTQQAYIATTVDPEDLITEDSRRQILQATENCAFNYLDMAYNRPGASMTTFQILVVDLQVAALNLQICQHDPRRTDCKTEEAAVRIYDTRCQSAPRPTGGWDCNADWNEGTNQFAP